MRIPKIWRSFSHRTDIYARRVLGDTSVGVKIVAGPYVRRACRRHLDDRKLAVRKTGHPHGWLFNEGKADLCIEFFEQVLRLPDTLGEDGEPLPFLLQPAQDFIVGSLMGWLGKDGYRRFREAYVETGKGSGKTPLAAGLGLYGLLMDGEQAPEIYSAAVTRDQAKVMFRDAERMVDAAPAIKSQIKKTVNNLAAGMGFFRPYSRDEGQKSGPRPSMALVDEVHEHPTGEVINKLRAGFKRRPQPLEVEITNSGWDRTSICYAHHEHATKMLEGVVEDDRLFAYVCALDPGDDPLVDESCWPKANPCLGVTITEEYLRRQVENARNIPTETNTVLRLNFCVWTAQEQRAIDMAQWQACPSEMPAVPYGTPCYAGLDMSHRDDLTALTLIWPMGDQLVVKSWHWLPEGALERYPHRPYDVWRRQGLLRVVDGDVISHDQIKAEVAQIYREQRVARLAYDRSYAEDVRQHLEGLGFDAVEQAQGFGLNEACVRLFELIARGELCHGGDPLLAWEASNLMVAHDHEGRVRPIKPKNEAKIDGIVALLDAMMAWIRADEGDWGRAPQVTVLGGLGWGAGDTDAPAAW